MVVSDPRQPDNPIVLANQAFLDLTGYSAEEVIGRNCRFLQGSGTAPEAIEAVRQGLAADEHFITVEMLNYRKDGSTFWNQLSISPVHDARGRTIYYFASQKDVSAQRRAEELEAVERLLLMEVDHRAMNALALVESILSLTRADDVNRYSDSVKRRISAIARVHRLLAHTSWGGAPIEQLITEEAGDARVVMHGPSTLISPRLAQPLAIIFHELVSNAIQHGALLNNRGTVEVDWGVRPDRLTVQWQEHGAHVRSPPSVMGLGLSLVHSIIERQLSGDMSVTWAEPFAVQLAIPLHQQDVT